MSPYASRMGPPGNRLPVVLLILCCVLVVCVSASGAVAAAPADTAVTPDEGEPVDDPDDVNASTVTASPSVDGDRPQATAVDTVEEAADPVPTVSESRPDDERSSDESPVHVSPSARLLGPPDGDDVFRGADRPGGWQAVAYWAPDERSATRAPGRTGAADPSTDTGDERSGADGPEGHPGRPRAVGIAAGSGALAAVALVRRLELTATGTSWPDGTTVRHLLGPRLRAVADRLPLVALSAPDERDTYEHEHRAALRSLVEESPGVHLSAAAARLEVPLSTLRHHVRALETADELATAMLLGRRRLFPPRSDDPVLAALNDDGGGRLLEAVVAHEPATGSELVEALDLAHSTVSYHLDRLEEAGIVERERRGNRVVNQLTADARETFATLPDYEQAPTLPSPGDD